MYEHMTGNNPQTRKSVESLCNLIKRDSTKLTPELKKSLAWLQTQEPAVAMSILLALADRVGYVRTLEFALGLQNQFTETNPYDRYAPCSGIAARIQAENPEQFQRVAVLLPFRDFETEYHAAYELPRSVMLSNQLKPREVLCPVAFIGYPKEFAHYKLPVGEGLSGRAYKTGEVLLRDDLLVDNTAFIKFSEDDTFPTRSEIAIPVKYDGTTGVITISSRHPNAFPLDIEDRLCFGIENAARVAKMLDTVSRDALTRLHGNNRFLTDFEYAWERAQETGRLGLILFDVNDLKWINDKQGHLAGNAYLRTIGHAVKGILRWSDLCYRCGGDEFAIILLDTSAEGVCHFVRERLMPSVASHVHERAPFEGFSPIKEYAESPISVGWAAYEDLVNRHQVVSSRDHFFKMADDWLYYNKKRVKGEPAERPDRVVV